VVSTYRKLIDAYCADPDHFRDTWYESELNKAANRAFCEGLFNGRPDASYQLFNLRDEHPTQEFVMRVLDYDQEKHLAKIEQRNYFKVGDTVEIFSPKRDNFTFKVEKIYNEDKKEVEVANHPMEVLYIPLSENVAMNDMGRKVKNER
jgi:putative protease